MHRHERIYGHNGIIHRLHTITITNGGQNMNLITMKESDAVERLTRITILLAKATLLFLPVSLMTAYFSTQLDGVNFTVAKYWIAFGVIFFISFVALLLFGRASGTVEGKMIYESLGHLVWKKAMGLMRRTR